MWEWLPPELQSKIAALLDTPASARLAEASKACDPLVRNHLNLAKTAHEMRVAAAARRARMMGTAFTDAERAFIDTFADLYSMSSSHERHAIVKSILAEVANALPPAIWHAQAISMRLRRVVQRRRHMA